MAKKTKSGSKNKSNTNKGELKMTRSPLMETFDNRKIITGTLGNTFKNIMVINVIVGIVILIINVYAILWINKLDTINCACSESYMRTYIKYYLYVFIPMIVIDILFSIYMLTSNVSILDLANNTAYNIYRAIRAVFTIFSIINIFIVIMFINKLKEINCECSEDIVREVYWIYNIVLACYISILLLMVLVGILMMVYFRMSR